MFLILGIVMLVCFGGVAVGLAKRANRPVSLGSKSGASAKSGGSRGRSSASGKSAARRGARSSSRSSRGSGGSWLLKAWNSSGAPKTSESSFRGASAVLTGKAAGSAARGGWWVSKKTGKAGRWFAGRTLVPFDKWLAKKRAGLETAAALPEPPPVFVHPKSKGEPVGAFEDLMHRFGGRSEVYENGKLVGHNTYRAGGGGRPDSYTPVNGATSTMNTTSAGPATLAPHLSHINDFEPESDAELLNFMGAEVAGKAAEAEAYMELFDRCVSGKGLDPQAMQGVSDYSEAIAESAEAMKRAHAQFVAVYEAIIEAVNNGTVMPHDGRFFSGEGTA